MKHYVQYHSIQRMGPPAPDLAIHTNKNVEGLVGHAVWLIVGEGQPRQYALAKVFVVSEAGSAQGGDFRYFARGSEGRCFDPPVALSPLPWFAGFLRSQANFSLGLHAIVQDGYIEELKRVAESQGYRLPD